MKKSGIDRTIFFSSVAVLLAVCVPLIAFPRQGEIVINQINSFLTQRFGFLYIWMGVAALAFALWLSFGRYGATVLGSPGEKPEFTSFAWISMMFCAGIGSGVMYWGMIEWVYYFRDPPLHLESGSWQAAEFAGAYGIFHWGPVGWALYAVAALPIAYCFFVKKIPVFKASTTLEPLIGQAAHGPLGKVVDICFIFGAVGAAGTSLGLGIPMISAGMGRVLGMPVGIGLKAAAILAATALFGASAYSGLQKGIQKLSSMNVYLMFGILLFLFATGPRSFILKMGTTSLGLLVQNFPRMATWMDPVLDSGFTESWTEFYWAWWIISAPLLGMFIARISRGRTLRQVILGSILYGTCGCALMFIVLGNTGMHMHLTGTLNVVALLDETGAPETIMTILSQLPLGGFVIALFTLVALVFTATTFDSISYTLAAVTTREITETSEPAKWNRLFWALAIACLPAVLVLMDGNLTAIQTTSIITAFPVTFIFIAMMVSFVKMLRSAGRPKQKLSPGDK